MKKKAHTAAMAGRNGARMQRRIAELEEHLQFTITEQRQHDAKGRVSTSDHPPLCLQEQ
jgi:hypothetical protein